MIPEQPGDSDDVNLKWLLERRQHFDELVGGVDDYAIFMMTGEGIILDWNAGARNLKGYEPEEIIGSHFSRFYSARENEAGIPAEELAVATAHGKSRPKAGGTARTGPPSGPASPSPPSASPPEMSPDF